MAAPTPDSASRLERASWVTLLVCVGLTPLAVTKFSFAEAPLTISPFGYPQNVVLAVGAGTALLLWGIAALISRTRVHASWPLIALLGMALWSGVATAAGYEPLRSLLGGSTAVWSFAGIAAYSAVAFLALQLMNSTARMRQLSWVVLGSSTAVAALAVVQQLFAADIFGTPWVEAWTLHRGFATLGNPDYLGTFLVLPLVLGLVLALYEPKRSARITAAVCATLALTALTGSLTRGAWIAAIAGVALAAVILARWKRPEGFGMRLAIAVALALACVLIAVLSADEPIAPRLVPGSQATTEAGAAETLASFSSGRPELWRTTLAMMASRPVTGTGPAAYELGWYGQVHDAASTGSADSLATDPHSFVLYVLATTGVPGALLWVLALAGAFAAASRSAAALSRSAAGTLPDGRSLYFIAWLPGAAALQVALLVGAVSTPIVLYAFLSVAMLLRPSSRPRESALADRTVAAAAAVLGVLLVVSVWPNLAAETAFARGLGDTTLRRTQAAAAAAPWNLDIQRAYYGRAAERASGMLKAGSADASATLDAVCAELAAAGARQPHEFYYPSVRARLLADASGALGADAYAEDAVAAADTALAIMPASIPMRVTKALVLSDLGRYSEMVTTLEDHWTQSTSSYPGIVYAQALALSGDAGAAWAVFDELATRFPGDASVSAARAQTEQLLSSP